MRLSAGLLSLLLLATFPVFADVFQVDGVTYFKLPFGSVQQNAIWPKPTIAVCWENPSATDGYYRQLVRQAVAATWEKYSLLMFTGWNACKKTPTGGEAPGIHIRIDDANPGVTALGQYLDAAPNGMVLDFSFKNWSTQQCLDRRDFCVFANAVHEFGHAIGFAHEQNRQDAPAECQKERQGTPGDWNITEYDPYSVMNYCKKWWEGDGMLSPRDIEAAQLLYGKR